VIAPQVISSGAKRNNPGRDNVNSPVHTPTWRHPSAFLFRTVNSGSNRYEQWFALPRPVSAQNLCHFRTPWLKMGRIHPKTWSRRHEYDTGVTENPFIPI